MNPSGWNGRGYKPDTFNDKDQIKYHVDYHPEIDVDVYYEYDAGDNSWWHFCDARDNVSGDKILGVCNPNVWSMNDKLMEAAQVLIKNGMSADDAYVALQAQCYILLDIEIDDYLTDEDYEELEEYEQQLNKKGM